MTQTSISGASPFCSVAEFLSLYDPRLIGDWLSTDGTRLTPTQLGSNAALALFATGASGEVESAMLVGGRYTPTNLLTDLTGNSLQRLKEITAYLILNRCWKFHVRTSGGVAGGKPNPFLEDVQEAEAALEALAGGEAIFAFQETADAGRLDHHVGGAAEIEQRDGLVVAATRYFGRRIDRNDPARP